MLKLKKIIPATNIWAHNGVNCFVCFHPTWVLLEVYWSNQIKLPILQYFQSQWPRGLRRRSAAARLLRLCVRISTGAWMFVASVVCYQVEVSATNWSLVQRSPTDCGACDLETSRIRRPWPALGRSATGKKNTVVLKSQLIFKNAWPCLVQRIISFLASLRS